MACLRQKIMGQNTILVLKSGRMGSSAAANKKTRKFNPDTFLATIGEGRKNLTLEKKQGIFAQGDKADSVFYIQKGRVKLTVVSKTGREATIGMLTEGNFVFQSAFYRGTPQMSKSGDSAQNPLVGVNE